MVQVYPKFMLGWQAEGIGFIIEPDGIRTYFTIF